MIFYNITEICFAILFSTRGWQIEHCTS